MKLLVCHNYYQQRGGEDHIFADEASLLESRGHEVLRFAIHNDSITGRWRLGVARDTVWNGQVAAELGRLVRSQGVELVHFHNTFPLISPAAYYAVRRAGAVVVQALHNFRLICPGATLLRDGKPCERCVGSRVPWPAVLHGCYRQSRSATAAVASMLSAHHLAGTYRSAVDVYIAMSRFARQRFIAGGLPSEKIVLKPNFVRPDPGPGKGGGGYVAFVGRLSPEKGIDVLLEAWSRVEGATRLVVVGDGPLAGRVRQAAARDRRIEPRGLQPLEEVYRVMGEASCLIIPSIWYEGYPKTLVESCAKGTPVIASNLGALGEFIEDGRTGLHFRPGDPRDLAAKIQQLLSDPSKLSRLREAARRRYEEQYSAEANYESLMAIYERALGGSPHAGSHVVGGLGAGRPTASGTNVSGCEEATLHCG